MMILATLRELEDTMNDKDALAQATDARLAASPPSTAERARAIAEGLAVRSTVPEQFGLDDPRRAGAKGAVTLGNHGRAQIAEPEPQTDGPFAPHLARRTDESL